MEGWGVWEGGTASRFCSKKLRNVLKRMKNQYSDFQLLIHGRSKIIYLAKKNSSKKMLNLSMSKFL